MRTNLAAVLAAAFVFATLAVVLTPQASAQLDSGALSGVACIRSPYQTYPSDTASSPPSPKPESDGCYSTVLPGATIHVTKAGAVGPVGAVDKKVQTDDQGNFLVTGLADGTYTVEGSRTGFETASFKATVENGKGRVDVPLAAKQVSIAGVVRGDGKPIADAQVYACCTQDGQNAPILTGADGGFKANALAGWVSFNVQASGFEALYDSRFVDGSTAVALELKPMPPADAHVRGTVRDQDGNPVAGVQVSAYGYCCVMYASAEGSSGAATPAIAPGEPSPSRPYYGNLFDVTDADGRFDLSAYEGQLSLNFQKDGYAYGQRSVNVVRGEDQDLAVRLLKYPAKDAVIVGHVIGSDGKALDDVYVNVQSPEYNLYECSQREGSGSPEPTPMVDAKMAMPYPGYNGCAITVHEDGSFDGKVTPGYAIVQVSFDRYAACGYDGSVDCADYYPFAQTMTLRPGDNEITVRLKARPGPDAVLSGYAVDGATQKAIPKAILSFSHQDNYGYGSATTDGDGSYKLRLRSGLQMVNVCAPGYLPWTGMVDVAAGQQAFDVVLTATQSNDNGCYGGPIYALDGAASEGNKAGAVLPPQTAQPSGAPTQDSDQGASQVQYEDLNGGLGPYDAAARPHGVQDTETAVPDGAKKDSPAAGILIVGLIGLMAMLRRRVA